MMISVRIKANIRNLMLFACCIFWCGCGQSEIESLYPESLEMNGDPVELHISLADTPVYGADAAKSRSSSESSSIYGRKFLVAEWVKPERYSLTRSGEDYQGPAIAAMELFEEPDSAAFTSVNTRAGMTAGYYFRVIAFKKSGSSYVYQSAADYTANGANAPVLKKGNMLFSMGQTYRFVAYSFNNNNDLGNFPASYTWNSTAITIPNLNNDFMTFDSGDKVITAESNTLAINFTHQLCELTVKISATGYNSNTFSNCTNVRVNQGGNSSSWTVGATGIAANTSNTANFNIANNSTATVRIVPFSGARTISVYFTTLTVGGKSANGTTVTSSQSIQLQKGRSYTMTVKFKKLIGVNVPESDINLTGNGCTASDKTLLSKIIWAEGNLKSTGSTNYVWTSPSDYGYYYTWYSTYTGNTSTNNTDPCSKLKAATYGTGWKTPDKAQIEALSRCTNKTIATVSGNKGMWFMNSSIGLFLPVAGFINYDRGSGTTPTNSAGSYGDYWSSTASGSKNGYRLYLRSGTVYVDTLEKTYGFTIRCIR